MNVEEGQNDESQKRKKNLERKEMTNIEKGNLGWKTKNNVENQHLHASHHFIAKVWRPHPGGTTLYAGMRISHQNLE